MSEEKIKKTTTPDEEIDASIKSSNSHSAKKKSGKFLSKRNILSSFVLLALIFVFLATIVFALYQTGYIDSYIKKQFVVAFDEMGIKFETDSFKVAASPLELTLTNAVFTNKKTGEKLFRVGNAKFDMTVLDLYALKTERDVDIDATELNDIEVWIDFDKDGNSNFSGIEILPPKNAVKFQYASAKLSIKDGLIHFGDTAHEIKGTAKNVAFFMEPEDPTVPEAETNYAFDFTSTKSEFIYDKSKVEPIDIQANGILDEKGAKIKNLQITSPIGTSKLSGILEDWESLKYDLKINSSIDLTQTSKIFPIGTPIIGTGDFEGTVTGEGEKYKIKGEIISRNLLASNISLKALKITGNVDGKNTLYNAHGKAVAELLTFKDFRVELPQLIGTIRGTGTDFKWFGELRSAAVDSPLGTIAGLFISDATAEYQDNKLIARLGKLRAAKYSSSGAKIDSLEAQNIKINSINGVTNAQIPNAHAKRVDVQGTTLSGVSVAKTKVRTSGSNTIIDSRNVRVNKLESKDAKLTDVTAKDVRVSNKKGSTNVTAKNVQTKGVETRSSKIGNINASDVDVKIVGNETKIYSNAVKIATISTDSVALGSLNIAGVRLSIRNGRIEGSSNDFEAGDVELRNRGTLKNVKISTPIFLLEPSGRYRASLDMSLGSGVLGSVKLGAAKAKVIANNDQIELNNLTAQVMDGEIDGNATIALNDSADSKISTNFQNLDLAKLLALQGGKVLPVEGKTKGHADFTFRGTDFRRASGTLTADISATAGNSDKGIIPMTGKLGVRATNGLFDIDYANLNSAKSTLTATGKFDLNETGSNLNLAINSSDASEIERIIRVLNLSPDLEQQLDSYQAQFVGNFSFDGNLTGNLSDPTIAGKAFLDSINLRGKQLGSLASGISVSPNGVEFQNGLLREIGGGSLAFSVIIPSIGSNNISVQATLDKVNSGSILSVLSNASLPDALRNLEAKTSGTLNLNGLPDNMQGEANLIAKNGSVRGHSFDNLESKITFTGTLIDVKKFDAQFGKGVLAAKGTYDTGSTNFNFEADGDKVPVSRILAFFPENSSIPDIEGSIKIKAVAIGESSNTSSYNVNFEGVGKNIVVNDNSFGNINFVGKTVNQILNANLVTKLQGQTQAIKASVNFADENLPFRAETDFDKTRLAPYIAIFRKPERGSIEIGGLATGEVVLQGNLTKVGNDGNRIFTSENLNGTADFSRFDLQIGDTPLNATDPIAIRFSMNEASIETAKFSGGGSNLVVTGTKAFNDNGVNNLSLVGKINLRILNALSKNVFYSGLADVGMRLTGINKTARLNGTAKAENATASTFIGTERISFNRLKGLVRFTTNQIQIEELTGFLGGGRITASGGASLVGLELDRFRLEVRGNEITARLPKDFTTTGNANIEINGKRRNGVMDTLISGTIYARRSVYRKEIDIANFVSGRRETSLSQTTSGSSILGVPKLDLRVLGRNALLIRNNLADLTASADLRITGDIEFPQMSGRITANSGTLVFSDDRYELQRGVLTFPPNIGGIEPIVNLQAETEISGYQIFVNLNGSLVNSDTLTATVRSNPSLPQADVISLITTGSLSNTANGIPTLAQSGLNTATEILTDEIINRPISRATDKLFGLNKFSLDPIISGVRRNPTARLTVGRQINRNLLITYSTNLSEDQNQVLALEYRISNRMSFIAQFEQRSLTNVTQKRKNFSFEVRLRKRF